LQAPAQIFQAAQVADLVGIPEPRLAKFVESRGYGITPSLRQKAGKGIPRLYTTNDLLAIALAWWLFQSGFRSKAIGRVLDRRNIKTMLRESGEWKPENAADRFLVIRRNILGPEGAQQDLSVVSLTEAISAIKSDYEHGFQVLPIGALLKGLWDKLRKEREG
jgi:hypothetical protein